MNQESIVEHIEELEAKDNLTKKERKRLKKLKEKVEKKDLGISKDLIIKGLVVGVILVIIVGLFSYFTLQPKLPPTSMEGHIEQNPPTHIVDKPIPDSIQRHMLEHSDGEGSPGVIIQYNCEDFECENDLVDNLKKIATEFPENVYLAPGGYDGKIILTRLDRIEILEEYNEEKIKSFIR